jgi:hypothetical protein
MSRCLWLLLLLRILLLLALLREHLHLLIALLLSLRHALQLLSLTGGGNRTGRHELRKTGQRLEHCLPYVRSSAHLREHFLKLLNDEPQPLQSSSLEAAIRRRLRCTRLTEGRSGLLTCWIWISGRGWHLLALVFAPTIAFQH